MAEVQLQNVEKVFPGGAVAVRDLSLTIHDGELLVVLGPSGCGKSTVLKLLAGLEFPTSGSIAFDGQPVTNLEPPERNIAMVFQNYALYPHMTVRGNLEFPLRMLGRPRQEIDRQVDEAARLLGLRPLLDRKPRQLSGGQAQRVAMGRAIVRDPVLFLMDEPLSNLDAKLRVEIRSAILELQRKLGTTTVYVTHDQVEALTLGERIAVLRAGELQQVASPAELYDRPANLFVAAFVGSPPMNLFRADFVEERGHRMLVLGDDRIPLPSSKGGSSADTSLSSPETSTAASKGGRAPRFAGLRPEALSWTTKESDHPMITAKVAAMETLGHERVLYLSTKATMVDTEAIDRGETPSFLPEGAGRMAARLPSAREVEIGETIQLALDTSGLSWFDSDGTAI